MTTTVTRYLPDEAATCEFADALWRRLPDSLSGWTMLLQGDLGAGKSTFARALIRAAGHKGAVPSPTYTLIEPYDLASGKIYHVDLYRVTDGQELHFLGWDELHDGLRLIEWPERAPEIWATADLACRFDYDGSGREARLTALSERAQPLVTALTEPEPAV